MRGDSHSRWGYLSQLCAGGLSCRWHNGPLVGYVKLRVAHAPWMPGTFSRHRGLAIPICVRHEPWCMPGSLTSDFLVGGWENVPGIPGASTTRNFTYLVTGLMHGCISIEHIWSYYIILKKYFHMYGMPFIMNQQTPQERQNRVQDNEATHRVYYAHTYKINNTWKLMCCYPVIIVELNNLQPRNNAVPEHDDWITSYVNDCSFYGKVERPK